jgi:hypothetical protein
VINRGAATLEIGRPVSARADPKTQSQPTQCISGINNQHDSFHHSLIVESTMAAACAVIGDSRL